MSRTIECNTEGCEKPIQALGFCASHYKRLRRGGDTSKPLRRYDANGVKLYVTVDPPAAEAIRKEAKDTDGSPSEVIRDIVMAWYERKEDEG